MKIRAGFVTNSSSTCFVLITCNGFSEEEFLKMAGVTKGSPWEPVFKRLYGLLREHMTPIDSYSYGGSRDYASVDDFVSQELGADVLARIKEAQAVGKAVYLGDLENGGEPVEALFCVESFELESDSIYLNALECDW